MKELQNSDNTEKKEIDSKSNNKEGGFPNRRRNLLFEGKGNSAENLTQFEKKVQEQATKIRLENFLQENKAWLLIPKEQHVKQTRSDLITTLRDLNLNEQQQKDLKQYALQLRKDIEKTINYKEIIFEEINHLLKEKSSLKEKYQILKASHSEFSEETQQNTSSSNKIKKWKFRESIQQIDKKLSNAIKYLNGTFTKDISILRENITINTNIIKYLEAAFPPEIPPTLSNDITPSQYEKLIETFTQEWNDFKDYYHTDFTDNYLSITGFEAPAKNDLITNYDSDNSYYSWYSENSDISDIISDNDEVNGEINILLNNHFDNNLPINYIAHGQHKPNKRELTYYPGKPIKPMIQIADIYSQEMERHISDDILEELRCCYNNILNKEDVKPQDYIDNIYRWMDLDTSHSILDLKLAYEEAHEWPPEPLQPIIDIHKGIADKIGQEKYQTCFNLIEDVIKALEQSKQPLKVFDDQINNFKEYISTIDNYLNEHDLSLVNEIYTNLNLIKSNIQKYYKTCNNKIFRFKKMKTKFGLHTILDKANDFCNDSMQQKLEMDKHIQNITSSLSRLGITE